MAEGREEAPKGSRVCGGASLDAAKKAGEREPGAGGAEEALRAQWNPSEGRLSRGEVGALRLRVWRWKVPRPRDHPAPRPPSPHRPPPRPPGPTPELGGSPPPEAGRAPLLPGAERPGSLAPRLPEPARNPGPTAARSSPSGADSWRVSGYGLLPRLLEPLLCCFSPFLSFFSIKVAAVGPAQGGWSGGISVDTGGQPDRPLPARRGSDSEVCALTQFGSSTVLRLSPKGSLCRGSGRFLLPSGSSLHSQLALALSRSLSLSIFSRRSRVQFGFSSGGLGMILGKLFPGLGWGRRRRSAIPVPSASRGSLAVENKVRCSPEPSPPSYAPPPSEVGKLRAGPSEQGTPRLLLLSGSFPSLFSSTTSRKSFQYLLKKLKVTSPQSDFNVNLSSVLYYSVCLQGSALWPYNFTQPQAS